jgi:hypothetical protein
LATCRRQSARSHASRLRPRNHNRQLCAGRHASVKVTRAEQRRGDTLDRSTGPPPTFKRLASRQRTVGRSSASHPRHSCGSTSARRLPEGAPEEARERYQHAISTRSRQD